VVVSAPAARSGWFVAVSLWEISNGHANMLGSAVVRTATDPETTVVAALLQVADQTDVFVLAQRPANGVRLESRTGSVDRDVVLVSPTAVLALPSDPAGLLVQAYEETGKPVGAPAAVSPADPGPDAVRDWSGRPDVG
jgi:hypothetical protein